MESIEPTNTFWNRAGIFLLICTALVVLAVPVFPSQDGPVHLYYVDIARDLLHHTGPYVGHFEIRNWLTPYSSEYLLLLTLETVFSPELSEKLMICCYIFAFGLAFRYLVNSVTERSGPWILAGIPFCMHSIVYLGFMNFCLALTLAMFLAGFWTRYAAQLTAGRLAVLLCAFMLLLLTHPVPVAIFLIYAGLYCSAGILVAVVAGAESLSTALRARWRQFGVVAGMGVLAIFWLSLFFERGPAAPKPLIADKVPYLSNLIHEAGLSPIVPFRSPRYRAGLLLLVAIAAAALLTGLWRNRANISPAALATAATSGICFTLYTVVPVSINGSFYFPQRFPILWLIFFMAAAAAFRPPRMVAQLAGVVAIAATCIILPQQWINTSRVVSDMSVVLASPPAPPGSVGVIIGELPPNPQGFAFNPFFWGGAHYFRRSKAILANAPWLHLRILMLRVAHPDRWYNLSTWEASATLAEAVRQGGAPAELQLVVREQSATGATGEALKGLGWTPLALQNDNLAIYERPVAPRAAAK